MDVRAWLVVLLTGLSAGLAANAVLGPLGFEVIEYHYSESMRNQGIGLDFVSLVVVAPLCLVSAALVARGTRVGPLLAFGPAGFAAYMMPQYVIGPDYLGLPGNNEQFFVLHFAMFFAAVALFVLAWNVAEVRAGAFSRGRYAGAIAFLLLFPVFMVAALYLPGLGDALSETPDRDAYLDNPTAFWIVAFLDLAVAGPAAFVSGIALWRGAAWAAKAVYAFVGWFALTPPSVAAMAIVMVRNDDPNGSAGQAVAFVAFAVVFVAFAAWIWWPLVRSTEPKVVVSGVPTVPEDAKGHAQADCTTGAGLP
jgi:hypothetical protein